MVFRVDIVQCRGTPDDIRLARAQRYAVTGVFKDPGDRLPAGHRLEKEELVQALGLSFTVSIVALSFNLIGAGAPLLRAFT